MTHRLILQSWPVPGMTAHTYRATCVCGWVAQWGHPTRREARAAHAEHEEEMSRVSR